MRNYSFWRNVILEISVKIYYKFEIDPGCDPIFRKEKIQNKLNALSLIVQVNDTMK